MIGDISHIIVVESLDNERKTGTEIYNDCIRRNIDYANSKITHALHSVRNKDEFQNIVNFYITNASYMHGGILFHLEMHGDEKVLGLIFSDGSIIKWEDLVDIFRELNIVSCNRLYISLATCNGRHLFEGVDSHKKSPYSCYISASTEVSADEIVGLFSRLFENLIRDGNLVRSYLETEKYGTPFFYKDSETTFEEAFKISADTMMNDLEMRNSILDQAEDILQKQGLTMPSDHIYDWIVRLALQNTYKQQKANFDFSNCEEDRI